MAARPAPITPTGNAGQSASSAPFRAAPAASTPSGAAPATAPQAGMIGGTTTPMISPTAMARPSPWQMASSIRGGRLPMRGRATATRDGLVIVAYARVLPPHCPDGRAEGATQAVAGSAAPASRPHDVARPGALRGSLRPPHPGDALLGDARPDGDHRAARGDLAGGRPARHLDLPGGELRRPDDADRA